MTTAGGQSSSVREAFVEDVVARRVTLSGMFAALVGAAVGAIMALERVEASCPDGTVFPPGATDYTCYAHPQGLFGVGVIAVSTAVGAGVFLIGRLIERR